MSGRDSEGRILHEVAPNETLVDIAAKYDVRLPDLFEVADNALSYGSVPFVGQVIVIPRTATHSPTPYFCLECHWLSLFWNTASSYSEVYDEHHPKESERHG